MSEIHPCFERFKRETALKFAWGFCEAVQPGEFAHCSKWASLSGFSPTFKRPWALKLLKFCLGTLTDGQAAQTGRTCAVGRTCAGR